MQTEIPDNDGDTALFIAFAEALNIEDCRIVDSLLAAGAVISEELLAMAANSADEYPQALVMVNAAIKKRKKKAYEKRKKEEKKLAKALASEATKSAAKVEEVIEIAEDLEGTENNPIDVSKIAVDMSKMVLLPVTFSDKVDDDSTIEVIDMLAEEEIVEEDRKLSPPHPPTALHENEECIICHENKKTILLLPCKHLCLCAGCFASNDMKLCPLCRKEVVDSVEVFL